MKAKELIEALSKLSDEEKELEVMACEEIWYYSVGYPRVGYLTENYSESKTTNGEKVIMIA